MQKKKGIADITFLIDATGSMQDCIDGLKENINVFIDKLNDRQLPLKEWRAKIVSYRDFDVDGDDWYTDNSFVTSEAELRAQLSSIEAYGGMDEPESLLDALHKLCSNVPFEPSPQEVDANKWRFRGEAARVIIIFTDASFHDTIKYPEGEGGKVADIVDILQNEGFFTFFFAPALPCYEELTEVDKCEWEALDEPFDESLAALSSDNAAFQDILKAMAKTISLSAPQETVAL